MLQRRLILFPMLSGLLLLFTGPPTLTPSFSALPRAYAAEAAVCSAPIAPVTLNNPTVVRDCTQAGVQAALDTGGAISFACGTGPTTIKLTSPLRTNGKTTVIDGGGTITLDGQNRTKILIKPFSGDAQGKPVSNTLTLQNLRLINGRAPNNDDLAESSGAALTAGSPGTRVHIINTTFENNSTSNLREDNQGGAIFVNNSYETIIVGSTFISNTAGSGGAFGGIATGLLVYNSTFRGNRAADASGGGIVRGYGGALYLDGTWNDYTDSTPFKTNDQLTICGSRFENNLAIRGGGALASIVSDKRGTKAVIDRSVFSGNETPGRPGQANEFGQGGAVYHMEDDRAGGTNEDNLEIVRSAFVGNKALKQGGAAWLNILGRGKLVNTTFAGNSTTAPLNQVGQGGAVAIMDGSYSIANATFANNQANFQGGALFAGNNRSNITLSNSIFANNTLKQQSEPFGGSQWQGFHTDGPLKDGGKNLQFPRLKPVYNNDVNNLIVENAGAIIFQDPLLEALADNGGATLTMALKPGSPAINAGANCPATDQRGAARVGACDIGAFEAGATPPSEPPNEEPPTTTLTLSSISPALIELDAASDFALTLTGNNFTRGSVVRWNGAARPTTFISSTSLSIAVRRSDVATLGSYRITVFDNGVETEARTLRVVESTRKTYLALIGRVVGTPTQ
jgi:hypothetical protein